MTGYYTAPVDPTSVDEVDISKMANHRHLLEDIVAANGDEARYLHESMKANRVNLTVPFTEPGYMSLIVIDLMLTPLYRDIDTRVIYYQAGRPPLARAVRQPEPPGFINRASTSGAQ